MTEEPSSVSISEVVTRDVLCISRVVLFYIQSRVKRPGLKPGHCMLKDKELYNQTPRNMRTIRNHIAPINLNADKPATDQRTTRR